MNVSEGCYLTPQFQLSSSVEYFNGYSINLSSKAKRTYMEF
jgi:hypothetical protein